MNWKRRSLTGSALLPLIMLLALGTEALGTGADAETLKGLEQRLRDTPLSKLTDVVHYPVLAAELRGEGVTAADLRPMLEIPEIQPQVMALLSEMPLDERTLEPV